jgi:hypothetical protein
MVAVEYLVDIDDGLVSSTIDELVTNANSTIGEFATGHLLDTDDICAFPCSCELVEALRATVIASEEDRLGILWPSPQDDHRRFVVLSTSAPNNSLQG